MSALISSDAAVTGDYIPGALDLLSHGATVCVRIKSGLCFAEIRGTLRKSNVGNYTVCVTHAGNFGVASFMPQDIAYMEHRKSDDVWFLNLKHTTA